MKCSPHRISKARGGPRPTVILPLVVTLLAGACVLGAARRPAAGGRSQKKPQAGARPPAIGVSLVWTGEQNGHLEPCGCSKPQLGGMLRRAGYLSSPAAAGPSLRLDNGDLTEARGRQDELKAETSIQLLNQLGYTAINLGETEFRLGLPYLQYLASSFKGSLLSANARDAAGQPAFKEYLLRELTIGKKTVSVGIAAHAPDDRAQQVSKPGETPLLTVGEDGKYLGVAQITPSPAPGGHAKIEKVRTITLTPATPEDTGARAIEAVYLHRVADEKLLEKVPRGPVPDGDHFVGTATCKSCHAAAHRVWSGSAHSHAWKTLVQVGHQRDPDCVGCHVVGLQYQGGFQDAVRTPHLENVGCESCHHAAGRHAASPAAVRPPKVGAAACAACHVPDHSPGFDFARFWAKIRH